MSRQDAAEFSFLLSLPAVLGAAFLDVLTAIKTQRPVIEPIALMGAFISFIVGLGALRIVFATIEKGELHKFSYYCWIVGTLGVVLSLLVP
jgi:undecaprenyl-diphosphatase